MDRQKIDQLILSNKNNIALFAVITGLLSHLLAMFYFLPAVVSNYLLPVLGYVGPSVNFSIGESALFYNWNYETGMPYNYVTILFFTFMLIAWFILNSDNKMGKQLLAFCFSVILIAELVDWVMFVLSLITSPSMLGYISFGYVISLLFSVVWIYLAFTIVRNWLGSATIRSTEKTERLTEEIIDLSTEEIKDKKDTGEEKTPIGQRLIHHIVDSILYSALCTAGMTYVFHSFFDLLQQSLGVSMALAALLVVARLLYYPFFETVLGTTPGKILTNSVVVKTDGSKLKLKDGVYRTLSRIVPFEPFSFFGSDQSGWHDRWTDTKVIKRKNTEVIGEESEPMTFF